MYINRWLNKVFKEKTIISIAYSDDGKELVFHFSDDTKVVIRIAWNNTLYALER